MSVVLCFKQPLLVLDSDVVTLLETTPLQLMKMWSEYYETVGQGCQFTTFETCEFFSHGEK